MATFVYILGSTDPKVYSTTDGIRRVDKNIPLEVVTEWAEKDPIWAQRGKAIQAYAQLESGLCAVMSALGEFSLEAAATIFYKITSTSARNSIMEKLLHKKHGAGFNPFWNLYLKELRTVDLKRNEIVHWLAAIHAVMDDQNVIHSGVTLMSPANMSPQPSDPRILTEDLRAFEIKCEEFARLAVIFSLVSRPLQETTQAELQPWRGIFQQPFLYPLPADHPLNTPPGGPQTPPQSS